MEKCWRSTRQLASGLPYHDCSLKLLRLDGGEWETLWIGHYDWESFDDPQVDAEHALAAARENLKAFLDDPGPDNGGWVHRFDTYGDLGPKYAAARRIDLEEEDPSDGAPTG
jgi:hypothetical protein